MVPDECEQPCWCSKCRLAAELLAAFTGRRQASPDLAKAGLLVFLLQSTAAVTQSYYTFDESAEHAAESARQLAELWSYLDAIRQRVEKSEL